MNENSKVLLIDGHSIANRAFYGLPDLTNSQGVHTNAVLGFLNIFLNVFNQLNPEYVVVAFDRHEPTFRHEMFKEYKGTRKAMPEELKQQIPLIKEALSAMNITTAELAGFEADDLLGSYSVLAEKDGHEVYILSGDRDLLQLATDKTMIIIPKTKSHGTEIEKYYASDVKEKYGVTPVEFIDMKALMGDSSDNIPGIPGIGEKTAANIIMQFHSLENAIEHVEEINPKKARENLIAFEEQGRMSKVLAKIDTAAPVPADFHNATIESQAVFFNSVSYEFFKKLELKKLIEKFDSVPTDTVSENIDIEVRDIELFEKDIENQQEFGLFIDRDSTLTAVSYGEKNYVYKGVPENILKTLTGKTVFCFDLKNLLHTLNADDLESDKIYDLSLMAYLLNPLLNSYSFDGIGKDYLDIIVPSQADLIGKKSIKDSMTDAEEKCINLAGLISRVAFDGFCPVKDALTEADMWQLYLDVEMPLQYSLFHMERTGVKVNADILREFSAYLADEAAACEKRIFEAAGEEFNINSPKQLGVILFEKLKLPHGKKTKTGYSTSADVLEKLAEEFPVVMEILKYRQLTKLKSTYADGLVPYIAEDGRIHGTFNQTVTATGRISSTEPNLQNIPIRNEMGQEIRKAFIPKEGCIFLDADYSQIELRLLAHISGDKNLIEAYKSDADIHRITASKVFKTPLDEVTAAQRRNAKAVNFGIVYGISSFGLSQGLSITRNEASEYIKQYFISYPVVKAYLDNVVKQSKNDGFVTTIFGRRRPIPELLSSNFMQRAFGERVAMNSPLQGSAADIMKIAMINVEKALKAADLKSRIVLQIHDELLIETYPEEAEAVKEILIENMQGAADLKVPLIAEVKEGASWLDAH